MSDSDAIPAPAPALPEAMRSLPVFCGLPIPWFCAWHDHRPDFRAPLSKEQSALAERRHVCIICGRRLRRPAVFLGCSVMGITRAAVSPPAHMDCAVYMLCHCLVECVSNSLAVGMLPPPPPPKKNFNVIMLWLTRVWELTHSHGPRFRLGPPERVEWYVDGRSATRAEVQTSLAEKMQELERHAYEWPGGLAGLRRHRASLNVWLPGK